MRNMRVLGFRIKDARLKAGMTISELASSAKIFYEDLVGVETGVCFMPFKDIQTLASHLNTTVKDLIEPMSDKEYMEHILGENNSCADALDNLLNYIEDFIFADRLRSERFMKDEVFSSLQEAPKFHKKNVFEDEEGELPF